MLSTPRSVAMVLLYVKKGEEASRAEVTVERVEGMRVRELREIVARTMGLEREELSKRGSAYVHALGWYHFTVTLTSVTRA